jgi:hypothetical protein
MKAKTEEKEFDAVKMMRNIREQIGREIQDLSYDELRAYIDLKLKDAPPLFQKMANTSRP